MRLLEKKGPQRCRDMGDMRLGLKGSRLFVDSVGREQVPKTQSKLELMWEEEENIVA